MRVNDRCSGRELDAAAEADSIERRERHGKRSSATKTDDFACRPAAFLSDDLTSAADRHLARHAAQLDQHAIDTRNSAPAPVFGEICNVFSYLGEKSHIRPRATGCHIR